MNWEEFRRVQSENDQRVDFEMIYVDMTGDLVTGLLLSQIVYWNLPDKYGKSKLRVFHDGHYWIAKARYEWWDEVRLSPKQVDRALAILEKAKLITKSLFKFDGSPTIHIRLMEDNFMALWDKVISTSRENPYAPEGENVIDQKVKTKLPKCENDIYPKGDNDIPERSESLTETTSETTSETTGKNNGASAPACDPPSDKPIAKRRGRPRKNPVPEKKGYLYTAIQLAVCKVCKLDSDVIDGRTYGKIKAAANALEGKYTPDQIHQVFDDGAIWWRVWPGKDDNRPPRPDEVRNNISKLLDMIAKPPNTNGYNGNGRSNGNVSSSVQAIMDNNKAILERFMKEAEG